MHCKRQVPDLHKQVVLERLLRLGDPRQLALLVRDVGGGHGLVGAELGGRGRLEGFAGGGEEGVGALDVGELAKEGSKGSKKGERGGGGRERGDGQDDVGGPESAGPECEGGDAGRGDGEDALAGEVVCGRTRSAWGLAERARSAEDGGDAHACSSG